MVLENTAKKKVLFAKRPTMEQIISFGGNTTPSSGGIYTRKCAGMVYKNC